MNLAAPGPTLCLETIVIALILPPHSSNSSLLQVLNIADFTLNSLKGPLCTKAYQRRAAAFRALQQYKRAVEDLEAAVANDGESKVWINAVVLFAHLSFIDVPTT